MRRRSILLTILAFAAGALAGVGFCRSAVGARGAVVFPASGQTVAAKADKNDGVAGPVAVADDGTVRAGGVLGYVDNGDGTITDRNTGLIWEKKSDDGSLHDKDDLYSWSANGAEETIWDWLDDLNAAAFAGHRDWRIPNVKELASLVDYEATSPAVHPVFDTGCTAGCTVLTCSCTAKRANYWTSTSVADESIYAWLVDFNGGAVFSIIRTDHFRVRAVRGGGVAP
jgi:hypothetical protein